MYPARITDDGMIFKSVEQAYTNTQRRILYKTPTQLKILDTPDPYTARQLGKSLEIIRGGIEIEIVLSTGQCTLVGCTADEY